ncbi:MAG: GNAT family N-acetyltransferase [Ignavibacteriaceae bacterium]
MQLQPAPTHYKKNIKMPILKKTNLTFHPLTKERWKDLEKLFGPRGAVGGCWCMWWRIKRSEYDKQKGEGNKKSLKKIINSGEVPGILAYQNDEPVAWCSIQPREKFSVLERSRVLQKIDDNPVWSIVCFFVRKDFRNKGLSVALIKEAINYAQKMGAKIIEGYPTEPKKGKAPDVFVHTGIFSAFKKAGFKEAARRSETRPVMRFNVK